MSKVFREIATNKDQISHPMERRYAVYCKMTFDGNSGIDCFSKETQGKLGDYDDLKSAEETASSHQHPVLIRQKALYQAKHYDF